MPPCDLTSTSVWGCDLLILRFYVDVEMRFEALRHDAMERVLWCFGLLWLEREQEASCGAGNVYSLTLNERVTFINSQRGISKRFIFPSHKPGIKGQEMTIGSCVQKVQGLTLSRSSSFSKPPSSPASSSRKGLVVSRGVSGFFC